MEITEASLANPMSNKKDIKKLKPVYRRKAEEWNCPREWIDKWLPEEKEQSKEHILKQLPKHCCLYHDAGLLTYVAGRSKRRRTNKLIGTARSQNNAHTASMGAVGIILAVAPFLL